MKAQAFLLGAAALLFAAWAYASHAVSSESQLYADRANAKVRTLLRAARLDLGGQSVSVRAKVDIDGRMTGVQVVYSSGSRDTDTAVARVLRSVIRSDPPSGLTDGAVILKVGRASIVEAATAS